MATNHTKPVTEAKTEAKPEAAEKAKKKEAIVESVYEAEELAKAHKVFNTSYEIVATALKLAGKDKATVTEAKEIIEKFKTKEVK